MSSSSGSGESGESELEVPGAGDTAEANREDVGPHFCGGCDSPKRMVSSAKGSVLGGSIRSARSSLRANRNG